ncbi:MAG: GNAT family N-acetyltransferase [Longibaculum sp.]
MNAKIDVSQVYLETERLLLRPWCEKDLKDFNEYASQDGVGEMAGWSTHQSLEESKEVLNMFIEEKKTFAIEFKSNHKVIGSLGIEEDRLVNDPAFQDVYGREIGYVLSRDYWGQGIMCEAVLRVIQYCFEDLHYDYLLCGYFLKNHQSARVNEKCGFQFLRCQDFPTRFDTIEPGHLNILWNQKQRI